MKSSSDKTSPEFWGACGVPECDDCLPRYDANNNVIEENKA